MHLADLEVSRFPDSRGAILPRIGGSRGERRAGQAQKVSRSDPLTHDGISYILRRSKTGYGETTSRKSLIRLCPLRLARNMHPVMSNAAGAPAQRLGHTQGGAISHNESGGQP